MAETAYKKAVIPASERRAVALQHGATPGQSTPAGCAYCGAPGSIYWPMLHVSARPGAWVHFGDLELDHIHPEYLGGPSTADNLALLCRPCNRRKGWTP